MPDFEIPDDDNEFKAYLDHDRTNKPLNVKYVKYLTLKELHRKGLADKPEYLERLKHEIGVVGSNPDFCNYFLIT